MKKLFLFLSVVLVGCTIEEDRPDQTANYVHVIKHLYYGNVSKTRNIEKSISDNGYRKDTVLLHAAIELLNNSDGVINKKLSLNKHYEYVLEKYNSIENKDTTSLNRAHGFLEKFNQTKDSVDYYNYLQNAMLLDGDILDYYCSQLGAERLTFYTAIFKEDIDTARINNLYTFIIIPADYRFSYSKVIVDSTVEIRVDNKKADVPIHYTQTGGAVIATLTPTQKGKYTIKGKISVLQKASKYTSEDAYSTSFIVK
jgi:hypothetical protein